MHEALAALERYHSLVKQLAVRGVDADLYHRLSLEMQEVRRCCHAVAVLSAAWVALLIAHAELSQGLWAAPAAQAGEERQRLLQQVLDCVHALRQRCMELVDASGGAH